MLEMPRVALFADTFHEINGAANVIRRLTEFARARNRPFLCVRGGSETKLEQTNQYQALEIKRSRLAISMDGALKYDPLLWRRKKLVSETLAKFKPDVIHVTGLNDISQLGFFFAHYSKISAVASWHTNIHEYTARRLINGLGWLPKDAQTAINNRVERAVLRGLMKLHFLAQVQLAPNEELVQQIRQMTRRPSFLMSRGVDTRLFAPEKRCRRFDDDTFILGYVGRLRPEKNVRLLAKLDCALRNANVRNYKFVIVGEGSESEWLRKNLQNVELTGVLRGEALAEAYANMDLFAFPSRTDAFGNVVLEAMAAGVPAVVMPEGGPKYLIEHGKSGFVTQDESDFIRTIVRLMQKAPEPVLAMREAARGAACQRSWEQVFETVYDNYRVAATISKNVRVDLHNYLRAKDNA